MLTHTDPAINITVCVLCGAPETEAALKRVVIAGRVRSDLVAKCIDGAQCRQNVAGRRLTLRELSFE